ncbi:tetratricopeptide repeat protein [bacterium]|nr:tetratricopeptide repeat protein [bacterium]
MRLLSGKLGPKLTVAGTSLVLGIFWAGCASAPHVPEPMQDVTTDSMVIEAPTMDEPVVEMAQVEEPAEQQKPQKPEVSAEPTPIPAPTPIPTPVITDTPPPEHYLFPAPLGPMIVPHTVVEMDDAAEAPPIFDALGEKAKEAYVQGALKNQSGYPTQAFEYFMEAVEQDPENLWLKNRAAEAALYQHDLPRAQKLSEEVLEADPDNYTAMLLLAKLSTYREKYDEAKEWYHKVLDVKDKNIEALQSLARIAYSEDQDLEKVKEYAGRILKVDGRNYEAMLLHAEASALTGDIQYAAGLYSQLVKYNPAIISRLMGMAQRLVQMDRVDDATELLREGVIMQPESVAVRRQWETILMKEGGDEAVIEGYEALLAPNPLEIDLHELFADYLARAGDVDRLEEEREKMLEINPRHVPSILSLARIAMIRGDQEHANELFERALEAGPEDASTYREIALVYMDQGKLDRAEDLLRTAMTIDPEDPDTLLAMAALSERFDDPKQTERLLKRALDLAPANDHMLKLLGDFYRRHNRTEEASQLYEQLLAVDPENTENQVTLAVLYFILENETALDRVQKAAPAVVADKFGFFFDYGRMAMQYGEWDRGRWAFEKALQISPKNINVRRDLATAYLHLNENEIAERTLLEAEGMYTEGESHTTWLLSMVGLYQDLRQYEKALEYIQKLLEENPDEPVYREQEMIFLATLGRTDEVTEKLNSYIRDYSIDEPMQTKLTRASVYQALGETDRAIGVLRPLVSDNPNDIELLYRLANLYGEQEEVNLAEHYYDAVIEESEGNPELVGMLLNACNNLAYLYATTGTDLDRAEELVGRALELAPRAGYILDTMGWVKFQQKQYAEAEDWLKRAEKLSLDDAELLEHLGDLYEATNRPELARRYYEKAAKIDPKSAAAEKLKELGTE